MKTFQRFSLIVSLALFATYQISAQGTFASFIYDNNYGCPPMTVTFTNTSDTTSMVTGPYWNWYIEGHGNYMTTNPPPVTFDQGGSYEVTLTLSDDAGFVDDYTVTIEVYTDPNAFWPADQTSVCPGENINFHVHDAVSWYSTTWDFGDGTVNIRDDNYVDHAYAFPGSYNVTLTMDHICGPDTLVQTIHVSDTATPVVNAWVVGSSTICPNELVTFNTYDIYESYRWDFGDGTYSTELNPSHFYGAQDTAAYTVVLEATNVCGNTGTDTIIVYVTNFGEANAEFSIETPMATNMTCPNMPVKFIPHGSATIYEWDLGDGTQSNERSPVNYYTRTGWYYVTLTITNGCNVTASHTDSIEVYLNYEDMPYVDFSFDVEGMDWDDLQGDTIRVCPGEPVEFENNSQNFYVGELRYLWEFGDGKSAYSEDAAHVYSVPGYYTVKLTATAPCGGTDYHTKVVWVDDVIQPSVTLNVIPEIICNGETVFFWDERNYDFGRYVYDIDFGDGNSLTGITNYTDTVLQTLASHIYSGAAGDTFNYVFTATNRCGNTSTRNGMVRITDDPLHKPFYYVENSTTSEENRPMPDWGTRQDPTDHELTIHLIWPEWPGFQNKFAVYFWYGGFDPNADEDPGPADGFVELITDSIQVGDSVKAYIPLDPLFTPTIGFAAGWTCSGEYRQGIEPEAWGAQMSYPGGFVTSISLQPYGSTDLSTLGPPIAIDPAQEWDGLCASEKPARHYYYQNSPTDYVQLEFDEEYGQYYLYATSDMQGNEYITDIASGSYSNFGDNIIEFCLPYDCCGTYNYTIDGDTIRFTVDYDLCSHLPEYLTSKPFIRRADFGIDYEDRSACPNDDVLFKIAGGVSYWWYFGDGDSSSLQNPVHSYSAAGTYDAFVVATNACGRTDTIHTPVRVSETNLPRAEFWLEDWRGDFPRLEPIQFMWGNPMEDQAGNLSFLWDFGDGNTSGEMNPSHAYARDGDYKVTLTVSNGCGSNTASQYLYIKDAVLNCEAKFADSTVNDTVYFTDISRGNISSWYWEFGDGSTSNLKDPVHIFPRSGVYFVCLSVYDSTADCAHQYCREVQIGILDCLADFIYSANDATKTAKFTDRSTNATEWFWDFGDGNFSDEQNPVHQYEDPGAYPVCLSIYNPGNDCFSEFCMEVEVGATDTNFCFADFSFFVGEDTSVIFTDKSSSNITNWYWTFGDGSYLEKRNPSHKYTAPGIYNVCLIVFDQFSGCRAEICREIPVGIDSAACNQNADFSFFIDINTNTVTFSDKSTGKISNYFWDFGDGTTSTRQNPKHQYSNAGFYLVTLSVRDETSDCADHTAKFLQIGAVDCRSAFEFKVDAATQNVQFYNKSKGDITEYYWDFGDGTYSREKDPMHHFERPGIYPVSLTINTSNGLCMDHHTEPVQVGSVACAADFRYFIDSATNVGYFTPEAIGTITDYLWIFGDGAISTEESPKHKFRRPGYHTVGLNTYDAVSGCMDYHEEILLIGQEGIDCRADYMYMIDTSIMKVKFKDQSRGDIVKWLWDFGDGTYSTASDTTSHKYMKGGQYMVCLTVVNSSGIPNTYCEWIRLAKQSSEDCFANFFYSVDSITKTVSFVDESFGKPDTWTWDFGDGTTSSDQDPAHTYTEADFYLVKLRISNSATGCRSRHSELINVSKAYEGLKASFDYDIDSTDLKAESYPVDFVGVSLGDAGRLQWSFGDGTTDTTTLNPTHIYASPGTYYVCLTITDPILDTSSTDCDSVTVGGASVGMNPYYENPFRLGNYPNPFEDMTVIHYELPVESDVRLAVFDHMGRMVDILVEGERQIAGSYRVEYDASGLNSGVYILRMVIDQGVYTSKMIIR